MPKKTNPASDTTDLRRRAEQRLREQHSTRDGTEPDTQRLVHELQVHQIELELQNEELQLARNEMEAGLEKYSDLYDFAPVGYLTLDRDGTIRDANLTSAGLLGIDRSQLVMRRFGLCIYSAGLPAFSAFLTRVFQGNARQFCEVTLFKEGKPPVEVRIEAAMAASGRECRAVLVDITAQKRAEQDRLILNKLESTGILAAGLAHDFNNLLAVIVLNLDLAETLVAPGQEWARCLEDAKQSALQARSLSQQLITFAKGGAPIRKLMALSGLIRDSVRSTLSGSNVGCEFFLADDLWSAEVDEAQLVHVLRNIVMNAREAMLRGGTVSVRAENVVHYAQPPGSLEPGKYVRISVSDQGGGIDDDVLPKIFDPYFSTKQRGDLKGMGLGLTVCYTVIQKHGGTITVESKVGIGTTFHIYLPALPTPKQTEKAPEPRGVPRPGRILVMDDQAEVREVLGRLLEQMGYEVELVDNGQKAIELYGRAKAEGRPFDAVMLDLTVPGGVGGMEAIQALLKIDSAVKAIVMSGYARAPVVLQPDRYGFKGGLAKPFERDQMREVLLRVLGARSPEQPTP